jgi:hypothetical protein
MADIEDLMPLVKQFLPFAKERMGFQDPPKLFLKGDSKNAADPLGRTAFYDPEAVSITLYTTDRHPKDIMRSLSHELVHHTQNCNGKFSDAGEMGEGYAQDNPHMREMERQAYEMGNMCFRDWEDSIKQTIYFEHLQKGDYVMTTKDWKNGEIKTLLSEAWGFKMDLNKLNEVSDNEDVKDAGEETEGDAGDETEEEDLKTEGNDEEEATLQEDSGEEEGEHDRDNEMHDDDHIKAIEHHLDALKHDKDYEEEHIKEGDESEDLEESCDEMPGEGEVVVMGDEGPGAEVGAADPAARVGELMDELKGLLMQLTGAEDVVDVDVEEEPMEERRAKGRSSARNQRGVPDPRQRPGAAMQEKRMRAMVRKAIKEAMK